MDNPKPRSSVSSSSSVSHTHKPTVRVEKISDFESVFSASYEAVLSVYREVTGKKGADRNTKEGARTLAQAMDAGELAESQVRDIIRNGSKDEKLPNQSLRGIANNYEKYLSGKKDDAPAVFYECAKCGLIHKDRWVAGMQTASGTESPIKCRCGGARRIP